MPTYRLQNRGAFTASLSLSYTLPPSEEELATHKRQMAEYEAVKQKMKDGEITQGFVAEPPAPEPQEKKQSKSAVAGKNVALTVDPTALDVAYSVKVNTGASWKSKLTGTHAHATDITFKASGTVTSIKVVTV